ncbi:ABC transporter permease [Pontibacter sp. G13]|uniref:ABC transporter permease n=1 Tax=Pontibacter sp. G13 TaxID=3074898 RepID=UPI00288B1FDF|nr:ABC transporter permease [Pontibacter sp. G13]WNJ16908.1 ABC transporter permease [Pontibacter sp. G13]
MALLILTGWIATCMVFLISSSSSIDPVELSGICPNPTGQVSLKTVLRCRERQYQALGLDLPPFYLSITNLHTPDDLFHITDPNLRLTHKALWIKYGDWALIERWQNEIQSAYQGINQDPTGSNYAQKLLIQQMQAHIYALRTETQEDNISEHLAQIRTIAEQHSLLDVSPIQSLMDTWMELSQQTPSFSHYIPSIHWHGTQNQYHLWISRLVLEGDFGISYITQQPIARHLWTAIGKSLAITAIAWMLSLWIGLCLGYLSARFPHSILDQILSAFQYLLQALPQFWVAMILFVSFTGRGKLPTSVMYGADFWTEYLPSVLLPIIAYSYGSFAIVSRTFRASLLEAMEQDFTLTAKAKGLSDAQILYRHILPHGWIPIITLATTSIGSLIAGSVIIEHTYSIPGAGAMMVQASTLNDLPTLMTFMTLLVFLTLISYLVADLLYQWVDPRIRLSHTQKTSR